MCVTNFCELIPFAFDALLIQIIMESLFLLKLYCDRLYDQGHAKPRLEEPNARRAKNVSRVDEENHFCGVPLTEPGLEPVSTMRRDEGD